MKKKLVKVKPYQERVIVEKRDLDEKIAKLNAFLRLKQEVANLPDNELRRLLNQVRIMELYSSILEERIENF